MDKETSLKMFGCEIDKFLENTKNSASYKMSGAYMIVAGLMSDTQELILCGDDEGARQHLNLAKMVLFEIMDGNLIAQVPRDIAA